jgi:hypothetical protein
MNREQQAALMKQLTAEILVTIDQNGGGPEAEKVLIIMGSLGAVIGSLAVATSDPERCMESSD